MHCSRQLLLFVVVASIGVWARSPPTQDVSAAPAPDLSIQRALIGESNAARSAGDYTTARAQALEVVTQLLARPAAEQDAAWLALLDAAGLAAWYAQDSRTASSAWKRAYEVRTAALPDDHPDLQKARQNLAATLKAQGDLAGARALFERVLEVRSRTLQGDHPDLQAARLNLAVTIKAQGDLAGALVLEEQVLEVFSRTLPDEHPDLQAARQNLALTLEALGDHAGARALEERVLEVLSLMLPDDHPDLQTARHNLAVTLSAQGDHAGARALKERVLEVRSRTLPDDHPDLQKARRNLALTLEALGDHAGARVLFERVLEVRSRTLPDDHPDLQTARHNLAVTLSAQGDPGGARVLFERVLEVLSRTLPDDHPKLQKARLNLADMLSTQGDHAAARALVEKVLGVRSRTLPDDHPDLQTARLNLAATIQELGDLAGARALQERALEVLSRTLQGDHPDLQAARGNLAVTLSAQGDHAGARALEEQVLEVRSRTLQGDHPDLQKARQNLALTIKAQGDPGGARVLFERVLEVRSRTLPDDHRDLQKTRLNLALTMRAQGDLAGARALFERVLEVLSRTLPDDHPDLQAATRKSLAVTIAQEIARERRFSGGEGESAREKEGGRNRCAALIGAMSRLQVHAARAAISGSPPREAEERCASLASETDLSLSFAQGLGVFEPLRELEPRAFALAETTRGAALAVAELMRRAAHSPKYGELREALRAASDEFAELAQQGTTSEEFDRARVKREAAERDLLALNRELSGGMETGVEFDVESLSKRLAAGEAAVAFRRFTKWRLDVVEELDFSGQPAVRGASTESLCAFVVRSSIAIAGEDFAPESTLTLVDLGPIESIEVAVRAWREGLGVASDGRGLAPSVREASPSPVQAQGALLRQKIFDPLLAALTGAQRIVVVSDDVLHLVPLDALPVDESMLVGDRWRIETRASLTELLFSRETFGEPGGLVAFGDVDYWGDGLEDEGPPSGSHATTLLAAAGVDAEPSSSQLDARATDGHPRAVEKAGILRGSAWSQGFSALPGTGVEVRGIARCFADEFGNDAAPEVCERANASRERLLELAPRARWLHIATHGWFAPESIKSWSDSEPIDAQSGLGLRMSGEEQVKGMSPMLLCGLALADANLPEDAVGGAPGLITAEEISALDLSNCELAVLSACDTNVGVRRAGQGVASLQMALQMAGAKSVITSLWKVPDEATTELMLDFYHRLWVEKKPKWQALWEAKMNLRDAVNETGAPKYTTRDWAAWVLTGEPE